MDIVIDVGNTTTKLGYFSREQLKDHARHANDAKEWNFPDPAGVRSCLVSSTTEIPEPVKAFCNTLNNVHYLSEQTQLPFINLYKTPATLGRDRIAGVAGARQLFPGRNVLVIDAGTSITYDLIDDLGRYHGGRISPGLSMRYSALHKFTGRLPEVANEETTSYLGNTTETAIRTGVFQGLVEEINGTIKTFANKHTDLVVALCGGDMDHLVNHVNYRIFALPNLILLGLHQILTHNVHRSNV